MIGTPDSFPSARIDGAVPVVYPALGRSVRPGQAIFLDDGAIRLTVEAVEGARVRCRVHNAGTIRSRKGVALPGVDVDLPEQNGAQRAYARFAEGAPIEEIYRRAVEETRKTYAPEGAVSGR